MAFSASQHWIRGARLPLTTFVWQSVCRNTILNAVNIIVVIVVLAVCQVHVTPAFLWTIPALLLIVYNAFWVTMLFAVLSTRFRDFAHLVQTVMRIVMFLTPIFWLPEQMGGMMDFLIYNPVTHFVFLLRDPILYGTFPITSACVVAGISVATTLAGSGALIYSRRKVVFWL